MNEAGLHETTIGLAEEGQRDAAPRNFKITLREVSQLNTHELAEVTGLHDFSALSQVLPQYLQKRAKMSPNILTCIVALNVMLRHDVRKALLRRSS
jgi:hypothetical protein